MSKLKTAGDLMIPLEKYPHIPYWFTIRQAMAELQHSVLEIDGRRSLPRFILVFDEQYRLMGLIRRRDLLRGLEPDCLIDKTVEDRRQLLDSSIPLDKWQIPLDTILEQTKKKAEKTVADVMRPIDQTCDQNENVFQVIYDMNVNEVSLIPVLENGRVIGVVRTVDVFNEICSMIL